MAAEMILLVRSSSILHYQNPKLTADNLLKCQDTEPLAAGFTRDLLQVLRTL